MAFFFFFFAGILFDSLGLRHSRILYIVQFKLDIKPVIGRQQAHLLKKQNFEANIYIVCNFILCIYETNSILHSI